MDTVERDCCENGYPVNQLVITIGVCAMNKKVKIEINI